MKKTGILILFLAVVLTSCEQKHELFNGKDLTGWVAYVDGSSNVSPEEVYMVQDGNLLIKGQPFGYLRTDCKYSNYTLNVEWRWTEEPSNSGIFQRVQDGDRIWCTAIECQLCNGKVGDFVMLGGSKIQEIECVGEFPVKDRNGDYENPAGEWNKAKIVCNGKQIKVYINDKLQNECTCEFNDGYIALQSEGGPLEFRNIYLTDYTLSANN